MKVGLGTDVAGGYSLDMMNAMRQAVIVSRMREGSRVMEMAERDSKLSIDWKEALFLATRGGATALGLQGMFGVGLPFDAQESELKEQIEWLLMVCAVKLYEESDGMGVGGLDYFESGDEIEKWWSVGDVRNRMGMWIQGRRLP